MHVVRERTYAGVAVLAGALLVCSCEDGGGGPSPPPAPDLYVDASAAAGGDGSAASPFDTIQEAIDAAAAGDIVGVAAGHYVEDLVIDSKGGIELRGAGKDVVTITGVAVRPAAEWPMVVPNIDITDNDVKIHGFTIKSPVVAATEYSGCIALTGTDIEIYDCAFSVATGDISQAIQTYAVGPSGLQDISGLHIHDCTFTHLKPAVGTAMYEGIYINVQVDTPDPANPVVIENNTFSGLLIRAITSERSSTVIRGNVLSTDAPTYATVFPMGIVVREATAQDDVAIEDNVIDDSGAAAFVRGLTIGAAGQAMTGIVATGNTVAGCLTVGILVQCDLALDDDVAINQNSITGNLAGLDFTGTANGNTVNAENNWWGAVNGPDGVGPGSGDTVSVDVDYDPWLTTAP